MKATTVQQVVDALEGGKGPVEITQSLSRELANARPELLGGWASTQRIARFGPGPYSGPQFQAFELRILPDADVPSRAELKARGKFDLALAEATEREAVAAAAYETAERIHLELFGRQIATGEAHGLTASGQLVQLGRSGNVTDAERAELKAKLADAQVTRDEAADALRKARVRLHKLERQADDAARMVRLTS